ncbi:MAG: hypothetical protein HWN65_14385 [Candidatus Helarchaeota archaeon]|nr:hypothetical protein [Candidatus Helarchaeota archaeon]
MAEGYRELLDSLIQHELDQHVVDRGARDARRLDQVSPADWSLAGNDPEEIVLDVDRGEEDAPPLVLEG